MALGTRSRKVLRVAGSIYLVIAGIWIFFNWALIIYFRGIAELLEILSPFNIVNYIVTLATLAPGLTLIHFGAKTPEEETQEFVDDIIRRSKTINPPPPV